MSVSRVQLLATLWTAARQAPLSMKFSRQEYWSELPFPSPGDLLNRRIEPKVSRFAGRFFTISVGSVCSVNSAKALKTVPDCRKHWGSFSHCGSFLYNLPACPLVSGPIGEAMCVGHLGIQRAQGQMATENEGEGGGRVGTGSLRASRSAVTPEPF